MPPLRSRTESPRRAARRGLAREADMADALPGILAIFNNVAAGREADFEEWYQHEDLEGRGRARAPGVGGGAVARRRPQDRGVPHRRDAARRRRREDRGGAEISRDRDRRLPAAVRNAAVIRSPDEAAN